MEWIAIDRHVIFGTDGELPKTKLLDAVLTVGDKKYELAVDGMYNPWFGDYLNADFIKMEVHYGLIQFTAVLADGIGI